MAWNLGYRFSFTVAIVPACSVLLFCTGLLLKNARRNWFVGIRTPWTLSSDTVWEKTHALGSRLLRTAAVLSLVAVVVADARWAIGVLVVPTAAAVLATVVYSYVEYGRLSR